MPNLETQVYWEQSGRYCDCDNNLILAIHKGDWRELQANIIFILGLGYV